MDIWEMMYAMGMINQDTWEYGKVAMMVYYGPDFGGEPEDGGEDEEEDEEGDSERRILSEEFIQDSSE